MNKFTWLYVFTIVLLGACTDQIDPAYTNANFPKEIEKILVNKCATAGCHNDKSYTNAANLNLSTWQNLFKGSVNGAVAIPFSHRQSSLFQFINTYADQGAMAAPTMPLNASPLTLQELITIKKWINDGCPSLNGEIPFAQNQLTKSKAYITNQGCDLVSVVDAASGLVMRYVEVGKSASEIELPHNIKVSNDKKYWYVCFSNGQYVQKFDAVHDQLISEVFIGDGLWNVITISPDDQYAYISDLSANGKIAFIDLTQMKLLNTIAAPGIITFPHGMVCHTNADTLIVTAQYGNMFYRILPKVPKIEKISLQNGVSPVTTPQILDPHEVALSPDKTKYFFTCQHSNEVRVYDMLLKQVSDIIPVGKYPLEMTVSKKRNWLFVSCEEDPNPVYNTFKGSVYVIDINTMSVIKVLHEKFFQAHGIAIDDKNDLLYVASRNVSPDGPAPHHVSECGGRNGFYHIIDVNTWKSKTGSYEISVDPYAMDIRE